MYTNKKREVDNVVSLDVFLVVRENHSCPHWQPDGDASLIPMHECWYCRFSDFRKDTEEHQTHSVCRCPKNTFEKSGS